mmetsp:Transcript_19617/g.49852  ORF Transcript_19617/g.49852 Transcript_19617/m.49852 type:complete len:276 (-) Transcript_19617:958-1785(-)
MARSHARGTLGADDVVVGHGGEEVVVRAASHRVAQQLGGQLKAGGAKLVAQRRAPLVHLLAQHGRHPVGRHGAALRGARAVAHPLPHLGAGDLGRGRVLHQVVDGHAAVAAQPRLRVHERHVNVGAHARLRHAARQALEGAQVLRSHVDVAAAHVQLVGLRHVLVKHLERHLDQVGVRHPGAVVARARLAQLVGAHLGQRRVVGGLVVLDGDLRRHAAHGVHAALVARLDEQRHVRGHEAARHRHVAAVGQHKLGVRAQLLDERENVVPAPAVEA